MEKVINIYCDGGSRGNPGKSALGVAVFDENRKLIDKFSEYVGINTNNFAEYMSLLKSLDLAKSHNPSVVNIFMDSELVIKQVTNKYRVKSENLIPLFMEVKQKEKDLNKVVYQHVRRNDPYQSVADSLVNEALDNLGLKKQINHNKNNDFDIIGIAKESDTNNEFVVYKNKSDVDGNLLVMNKVGFDNKFN